MTISNIMFNPYCKILTNTLLDTAKSLKQSRASALKQNK